MSEVDERKLEEHLKTLNAIKAEVKKAVVAEETVLNDVLTAILSNGHVLLEGTTGTAKTLVSKAIATAIGCEFKRIQFTPDLLPTDLIGITSYSKEKGFYVVKGPIFTHFVLANGINRAPPKVQSALLECMQERQATIGKETFKMPEPFFVIATQNPLESMGTYPLPEAQVDRFMIKIVLKHSEKKSEQEILEQNTILKDFEEYKIKPVVSMQGVLELQEFTKKIFLSEKIEKYIVKIIDATRNPSKYGLKNAKYIECGASPRGSIALYICSKANALLQGKSFVLPEHVSQVAENCLRHRIILNYEGQADNIKTEDIIQEILKKIKAP